MDKVKTEDIRIALRKRYCQPEYSLCEEVETDHGRRADAMAINMWPSRKNAVIGFEIKISRSDLKRELQSGAKAEASAKYCNYWMLVVPKGLINESIIIPENWGIMEYANKVLRIIHQPEHKEAIMTAEIAASLMRAKERDIPNIAGDMARSEIERIEKRFEAHKERIRDELLEEMDGKEEEYLLFKQAIKESRSEWRVGCMKKEEIISMIKLYINKEKLIGSNYYGLKSIQNDLNKDVEKINEHIDAITKIVGEGKEGDCNG